MQRSTETESDTAESIEKRKSKKKKKHHRKADQSVSTRNLNLPVGHHNNATVSPSSVDAKPMYDAESHDDESTHDYESNAPAIDRSPTDHHHAQHHHHHHHHRHQRHQHPDDDDDNARMDGGNDDRVDVNNGTATAAGIIIADDGVHSGVGHNVDHFDNDGLDDNGGGDDDDEHVHVKRKKSKKDKKRNRDKDRHRRGTPPADRSPPTNDGIDADHDNGGNDRSNDGEVGGGAGGLTPEPNEFYEHQRQHQQHGQRDADDGSNAEVRQRRSDGGNAANDGGNAGGGDDDEDPAMSDSELESKRAALLAQLNEQMDE